MIVDLRTTSVTVDDCSTPRTVIFSKAISLELILVIELYLS